MRKKQLISKKPAYFHGQLLDKDDFIDEQKYHINERANHSVNLHGWGVVRGLDVTAAGDSSITISAGYAVDGKGRVVLAWIDKSDQAGAEAAGKPYLGAAV